MTYTLTSYLDAVRTHTVDPATVVSEYLLRAKNLNHELNAFVRFHDDYIAANQAQLLQLPFAGAPLGVKDIFMTQ
jgi:Asp-tRNA(Asn)/Glu-tRNA(Gln) amidotransferase A subunit family amidase